jgi:hypothetical protein
LDRLSERLQSYLSPACVHPCGIIEGEGTHLALFIPVELSSVELRATLEAPDPILQHRNLDDRDIAPCCGGLE